MWWDRLHAIEPVRQSELWAVSRIKPLEFKQRFAAGRGSVAMGEVLWHWVARSEARREYLSANNSPVLRGRSRWPGRNRKFESSRKAGIS